MSLEIFSSSGDLSEQEIESLIVDELSRRRAQDVGAAAGTAVGGLALGQGRAAVQGGLVKALRDEFQDIREDPERQARQMDQMARTVQKYYNQGNEPVEEFIDLPGQNQWAAARFKGDDIVLYDSTAPHPAVMAHELGHVQMNHSNDPLSFLQHSGLGKKSAQLAIPLGAAGALIGRRAMPNNRLAGTALGGLLGTVGASGNFAYELGGASGRALGYLPEDVDQIDAAGDLLRAGMTYGMAGPGTALVAATTAAGIDRLLNRRL